MNKTLIAGMGAVLLAGAAYWWWEPARTAQASAQGGAASGVLSGAAAGPAAGASAAAPPVSVTTVRVQQRDFEVQLDATGTVAAVSSVELRPQISSVIRQVHIREGDFVKAGQLLFTLDVRADEANVNRAKAQLQRDQIGLADAQRQLARSRELLAQNFVSQGAVDTVQTLVDTQTSLVNSGRAAIETALVSLGYGRIKAPAAGRAGAVNVFAGSSVQANTTPLVTITQLDPVLVSFSLPQRNVSDALRSLREGNGRVTASLPERAAVVVGKLQFVDSAVDASSGTVKVKALFNNKDQALWPGAYVNVRMTVQTLKNATVLPQASIVQNTRGRGVYVVDTAGKANLRPVELLQSAGAEAVVSGVRAGERVVIDGRQNLRPGSSVVERPADAASGARGRLPGAAASAGQGGEPAAALRTDDGADGARVRRGPPGAASEPGLPAAQP